MEKLINSGDCALDFETQNSLSLGNSQVCDPKIQSHIIEIIWVIQNGIFIIELCLMTFKFKQIFKISKFQNNQK